MNHTQVIWFGVSILLTASTIAVRELLWHLGQGYWLILGGLAVTQLIATGVGLAKSNGHLALITGLIGLLVVGQLWALEMIAMQVIWRFGQFAP